MRKRVLVIDDVPDWRDQLHAILKNEFEVTTVDNYEDAISVVKGRAVEFGYC